MEREMFDGVCFHISVNEGDLLSQTSFHSSDIVVSQSVCLDPITMCFRRFKCTLVCFALELCSIEKGVMFTRSTRLLM